MGTTGARCSHDARFVHEAVFYEGEDDFAAQAVPFILDGLAAGEPIMVAVGEHRTRRLRAELGDGATSVQFAEMETLGRNPARIISAWRDFVAAHGGGGPLRGIGEPIWPGRSQPELAECHRHEALLNVAFDDGPPWWLLCPYDATALEDEVLDEARRTHPVVRERGQARPSPAFPSPLASEPFHGVLPEPFEPVHQQLAFGATDLALVRRMVAEAAAAAGIGEPRAGELVLCVSELGANSVMHGGGTGVLRIWHEDAALVCEVRDRGALREPLTGRVRPAIDAENGRGVWFANTMCDLVQIRSQVDGTVVRVRMTRTSAPGS